MTGARVASSDGWRGAACGGVNGGESAGTVYADCNRGFQETMQIVTAGCKNFDKIYIAYE